MSLGKRIRAKRLSKGWTQQHLASGMVTASMISQIESGKANPSYKVLEALSEKLDTPLEYFLADVDLQMEYASLMKVAKAFIEAKKYAQAAKLLHPLLEQPITSINQAEVRLELGDCYLNDHNTEKAIELFNEAQDIFDRKGDKHGAIRTLHKLGLVQMNSKKHHVAVFHWRRALDLIDQVQNPDPFVKATLLLDLGGVVTKYGEPKEALSYYDKAHKLLSGTEHLDKIAEVNLGLANSWINMGDFQKALEYADQSVSLYEANKNIKISIDLKKQIALLKVRENKIQEALTLLGECMGEYRRHHFVVEELSTMGEVARIHLLEGQIEKCFNMCEECLKKLPSGGQEAATVMRTQAIALSELDQLEDAVELLLAALEVFKKHKRMNEVADTYSELAEVYQKRGEYELSIQALQSLKECMEEGLVERGIVL